MWNDEEKEWAKDTPIFKVNSRHISAVLLNCFLINDERQVYSMHKINIKGTVLHFWHSNVKNKMCKLLHLYSHI